MKIYQIVLYDKIAKKTKKVEDFKTENLHALNARLYNLQSQYCEDEKPTIFKKTITSNGLKLLAVIAESSCDFVYMAVIKVLNKKQTV